MEIILFQYQELFKMEKTINILELSSELADFKVRELIGEESKIYVENDGIITYTDVAQDLFNQWYDFYYDIIDNLN